MAPSATLFILVMDAEKRISRIPLMQAGAIRPGQNVLIMDDLLATGMQTFLFIY